MVLLTWSVRVRRARAGKTRPQALWLCLVPQIASGVTSNSCAVKDYAACAVGNSSNQDRFSVCASPAPKCFYGGVFDGHGEAAGAVSAEAVCVHCRCGVRHWLPAFANTRGSFQAAQNVATRLIRGLNAEVSAGSEPNCDELIRQSFKLHQEHCARVYEEVTLKEVRALKAKLEAEAGVDVGVSPGRSCSSACRVSHPVWLSR